MELGFVWHIGHGGDPCPYNKELASFNDQARLYSRLTIVHTDGIFTH
ncbi:hypothetical protein ID866_12557, partial [Astraeus odoratus]